jgi:hypothetical protein
MSLPAKLKDVIDALEEAGYGHPHYLDRRTGQIFLITNEEMEAAEEDEPISDYPEWQRDSILKAREILGSEDFVVMPDQFEINEYRIMEDFCLSFEDREIGEDLLRQIKGSGAFGRFKHAIYSLGVEKAWYQFRSSEFERIATDWLEQEEIPYTRDDEIEAKKSM